MKCPHSAVPHRSASRYRALAAGLLALVAVLSACSENSDTEPTAPVVEEQTGNVGAVAPNPVDNPLWDPPPTEGVAREWRSLPPTGYVRLLGDGSAVLTWNGAVVESRSYSAYRRCSGEDAWTPLASVSADTLEHKLPIDRLDCPYGLSTTNEFGDEGEVAEAVVVVP